MSDRITLTLSNPVQARPLLTEAWTHVKALLMAGHRLVLEIRAETRSDAQNRLLHARLHDVARQCTWDGERQDVDTWRRLFTSAWMRTQGQQVRVLRALDGNGVDIVYASTRKLSRAQCADLSEFIMAWGSDRGTPVRWSVASLGGEE